MQIVADMLYQTEQCGQEGIKTTSLLTKANLSHSRLEKFVKNLKLNRQKKIGMVYITLNQNSK